MLCWCCSMWNAIIAFKKNNKATSRIESYHWIISLPVSVSKQAEDKFFLFKKKKKNPSVMSQRFILCVQFHMLGSIIFKSQDDNLLRHTRESTKIQL